jgi:alpha-beta hydrolase superfamily lysophospholipase
MYPFSSILRRPGQSQKGRSKPPGSLWPEFLFRLESRPVKFAPVPLLDRPPGTKARANTEGDERMSTPADHTRRASHSSSVPPVQETRYLSHPEGRIGYDVAGAGSLVILVPGMGDLRAGYRFLTPALRAAGYRVACTDLRGHGDSDATFTSYGDEETAGDVIALIEVLGGPAVVVGNSMGAGSAVLAAAQRPGLVSGLVLVGPFVRNGKTSTMRRLLLRAAMAPPWAAASWKSYLPTLRTPTSPIRGPKLTGSPAPCGHRS